MSGRDAAERAALERVLEAARIYVKTDSRALEAEEELEAAIAAVDAVRNADGIVPKPSAGRDGSN